MGVRDYERLTVEEFGRHLITSGDLDPVYIALRKVDWTSVQLDKWLIAYWCFYHCGFACYASDFAGEQYWDRLMEAAVNEVGAPVGGRFPRGHERRHARGTQGIRMIQNLRGRYPASPSSMIRNIISLDMLPPEDGETLPFNLVSARVQTHTLFGPWIAFKVADMVDRVLGAPVNFDNAAVFMFKDPMKAAYMLWRLRNGLPDSARPRDEEAMVASVVDYLKKEFSDLLAPPLDDRPIDLQEVETVLCKFKSHMNGHYPLNNDIDEINEGLEAWSKVSRSAFEFKDAMPERING